MTWSLLLKRISKQSPPKKYKTNFQIWLPTPQLLFGTEIHLGRFQMTYFPKMLGSASFNPMTWFSIWWPALVQINGHPWFYQPLPLNSTRVSPWDPRKTGTYFLPNESGKLLVHRKQKFWEMLSKQCTIKTSFKMLPSLRSYHDWIPNWPGLIPPKEGCANVSFAQVVSFRVLETFLASH